MTPEVLMIIIFFAILLGSFITIILVSAYKRNKNRMEQMQIQRDVIRFMEMNQKNQQNIIKSNYTPQQQTYRPQTNYQNNNNYVPPVNKTYVKPQYTNQNYNNNQNFPYQAANLLTEREYKFFKVLKVIAERNNLNVLMKIRLADLVKVSDNVPKSEFYKYFNKISAKHIDFALIDETKVIALIELDDSTHNRRDRIERDNFVNETVIKCGYKILHTYGDTKQIEDTIIKYRQSTINAIG